MRKLLASFLVVLFVVGVLILPAVHRIHCADHHRGHDTSGCPVCQLADAGALSAADDVMPAAPALLARNAGIECPFVALAPLRDPTQARAPPSFRT